MDQVTETEVKCAVYDWRKDGTGEIHYIACSANYKDDSKKEYKGTWLSVPRKEIYKDGILEAIKYHYISENLEEYEWEEESSIDGSMEFI